MSNQRFIELSSSYRDRTNYPKQASFEIPFAQATQQNQNIHLVGVYQTGANSQNNKIFSNTIYVKDTTVNGIIDFYWGHSIVNLDFGLLGSGSTTGSIVVQGLQTVYSNVPNIYVGYQLNIGATTSIITSYTPSTFTFTIDKALTAAPISGTAFTITDPSTNSSIVIPAIDSCGKNIIDYSQIYNNYYIINETLSQLQQPNIIYSVVSSYNFRLRTATLQTPFPSSWAVTDNYSLRKTLPNQIFTTLSPPFPLPTFPPVAIPNTSPIQYYPQLTLSTNCIFLPSSANPNDNYYSGQYIYVYPTLVANNETTSLTNIQGSCFYIQSYVGNGYNACFVTNINTPEVSGSSAFFPSYTNTMSISLPTPGSIINIVSFLGDNGVPLNYNGSTVSQNELVAYEISLVNLTLPNKLLVTGSTISRYPYVYVELSVRNNLSINAIYSNNPKSTKAMFLVPITDIKNLTTASFIRLNGGSMTQTVKFKPNDCLKFSVYLPDGTLFDTVMNDYYSPSRPNPLVQIDALFGIERLSGL